MHVYCQVFFRIMILFHEQKESTENSISEGWFSLEKNTE